MKFLVCCSCGYIFEEEDRVPFSGLSGMPPGCPECGSDDLMDEEVSKEKIARAKEFCYNIRPYMVKSGFCGTNIFMIGEDTIQKMADEIHRIRISALQLEDSIDRTRIQESADVLMESIEPFLKRNSNERLEKARTTENKAE